MILTLLKNFSLMAKQPILNLPPTPLDRCLDGISFLLLLALLATTFYYYKLLPEIIPTHFNALGEPDAFGDKSSIFLFAGIAVLIYVVLYMFKDKPHLYNYPTTITAENAAEYYNKASKMMRFLNLVNILIFFYLQYQTIQTALGKEEGLGQYFIIFVVIGGLLPLLTFVFSSKKKS